ncbi:uncharacterized protein PHACADRAFT_208545 [Phanerochaete carnosa HHB-10118-sp]|uniref:Uncharacterized protein n=1 Tax=Phanerochaete carnosa (strain HHB-10118-sp) TaxID=650164 RepID=K5W770_PHACS|nr:uncharacterized protein PHACADRAFT_208545 [Phanerochaete carnosa HHB-10118-sp]EKM55015.1 hypothetical protein PHACADRAFT_208545 [Phanerochaete carnosa HHB-10118-sp]
MYTLAPQNASAVDAGSWYPSPASRGTWQIISTCISTLVICVWSAIHIDIPPNRRMRTFPEKARWLIVGLLGPDWLLYTAFYQLCCAWELSEHASDCLPVGKLAAALTWQERLWRCVSAWGGRGKDSTHLPNSTEEEHTLCAEAEIDSDKADTDSATIQSCVRKNTWTFTHSYYAAMGGFVLDSSQTPVFGTETRLVLAPWMIQFLMKHDPDLIPDISKDDIVCQSKSGGLAKALLVVQLLYFAVSCTARLAQALPLSLLEVWTLAHALGAIFVYAIWWKKPLDIPKPTEITGKRAHEFAAYFQVVCRPIASRAVGLWDDSGTAEMDYLEITSCAPEGDSGIVLDEGQETLTLLPTQSIQVEAYAFAIKAEMTPDPEDCDVFGKTHRPWQARERGPDGRIMLGKTDVLRWRLAARAATRIGGFRKLESYNQYTKAGGLQTVEGNISLGELTILLTLVTAYVLPHLLGWNATFPTRVERVLWHVTSVAAVAFPITLVGTTALGALVDGASDRMVPHAFSILINCTWVTLVYLSVILYILANVYFLVESLRQLSYLPDSAFLLPNFSIYFPHFS